MTKLEVVQMSKMRLAIVVVASILVNAVASDGMAILIFFN